ncbi:MAG: DNA-binding response regulator [Calditrichaeota bacterium]|nr:MAG: DNA-binding response regulator [Calditrichota bacterium]
MSEKIKILLLEDDTNLGMILEEHLTMNNYDVTLCRNGVEGLEQKKSNSFELCLVDIMMPKMDGFTFVEQVRKDDEKTPIIFLTAKSFKEDKIKGFQIGCDDYITKPFSIEELLLRIEAILKRSGTLQSKETSVFDIGKYIFDYKRQLLRNKKNEQKLTAREADLLRLLCRHQNQTVTRELALKEIWQDDSYFAGRSMDVFISKLRKYLKDDPSVEILGIHGKGFRLVVSS